jgi:hypothetical protein
METIFVTDPIEDWMLTEVINWVSNNSEQREALSYKNITSILKLGAEIILVKTPSVKFEILACLIYIRLHDRYQIICKCIHGKYPAAGEVLDDSFMDRIDDDSDITERYTFWFRPTAPHHSTLCSVPVNSSDYISDGNFSIAQWDAIIQMGSFVSQKLTLDGEPVAIVLLTSTNLDGNLSHKVVYMRCNELYGELIINHLLNQLNKIGSKTLYGWSQTTNTAVF